MKSIVFSLAVIVAYAAQGQGTFIYDQQSSTDESPWPYGAGGTIQQIPAPFGQSFTPAFPAIDFVRLKLNDPNPNNALGATLYLNLRTNSVSGPILSSSTRVNLADSFTGVVNFFFADTVSLTAGSIYFFEPVVDSGDQWNISAGEYNYPGGSTFIQGLALPGSDLWFREGIVPEPTWASMAWLVGAVALWLRHRARRDRCNVNRNADQLAAEVVRSNLTTCT